MAGINPISKIIELSHGKFTLDENNVPNYKHKDFDRHYLGFSNIGIMSQTNKNGMTYNIIYPKNGDAFITRETGKEVQKLTSNLSEEVKGQIKRLIDMYKKDYLELKHSNQSGGEYLLWQLGEYSKEIKKLRKNQFKWVKI